MKTIVLLVGVAGSGKTTYRHKHYEHYNCISPDQRRMRVLDSENSGKFFDQSIEKDIWKHIYEVLEHNLTTGNDIIFDATNLTFRRRYPIVARARKAGYIINFVYFEVSLHTLAERNETRSKKVPNEVIARQYLSIQPPEYWEYETIERVGRK